MRRVGPRWAKRFSSSGWRARRFVSSVGFLSDVEGNVDFFRKSLAFSSIVRLEGSDENLRIEFRKDQGTAFVFGGDVCDHGVGDIRVTRSLCNLKNRFPDRVFLLAGNRDLNKLYFAQGLWKTWKSDREHCISMCQDLLRRMGAPNTFSNRRQELEEMSGAAHVDDEQVTASFVHSIESNGFMLEYLTSAQLAVVLNDTLFVHGAIPESGLGFVPEKSQDFADAREWVDALNDFFHSQVQAFARDRSFRAVKMLTEYGRPGGFGGRGVIYNDWLQANETMPARIPDTVAEYFTRAGINRIVCGHRPHGDTPTVIKHETMDFSVITADTSYSDKSAADNRGDVVYEVKIDESNPSKATVRGKRSNGQTYSFVVEEDSLIGRPWREESGWTKAVLDDGKYLVCRSKGPGTWSSDLQYSLHSKTL